MDGLAGGKWIKMPTTIEINNPYLTYCKKYDVHCECPKCHIFSRRMGSGVCPSNCDNCNGKHYFTGRIENPKESKTIGCIRWEEGRKRMP
jgi:hypothetical protein